MNNDHFKLKPEVIPALTLQCNIQQLAHLKAISYRIIALISGMIAGESEGEKFNEVYRISMEAFLKDVRSECDELWEEIRNDYEKKGPS